MAYGYHVWRSGWSGGQIVGGGVDYRMTVHSSSHQECILWLASVLYISTTERFLSIILACFHGVATCISTHKVILSAVTPH